jgi:hypothetical protein
MPHLSVNIPSLYDSHGPLFCFHFLDATSSTSLFSILLLVAFHCYSFVVTSCANNSSLGSANPPVLPSDFKERRQHINIVSDTLDDYSDPGKVLNLPFPSPNAKPTRFSMTNNAFSYMGREKFNSLWTTWLKIKDVPDRYRGIYVYGTMGYGKSHILAAFTCLLMRQGERVIYVPDCRKALQTPLTYLRDAFLFAFHDDPECQARISGFNELKDLQSFSQEWPRSKRLCFIIDQINALDVEEDGKDSISEPRKNQLREFFDLATYSHISIKSASANHKTARHMEQKQTDEEKLAFLGGMTAVSICCGLYFLPC